MVIELMKLKVIHTRASPIKLLVISLSAYFNSFQRLSVTYRITCNTEGWSIVLEHSDSLDIESIPLF